MKPKREPKKKVKKLGYSIYPKNTPPVENLGKKIRPVFGYRNPYND